MTDAKPRFRQQQDGTFTMRTSDGLQNVITGMGTERDSTQAHRFVFSNNYQDWTQFEAAFVENWLARKSVIIPVEDSTREWREIQHEEAAAIAQEEERAGLQQVIQRAFIDAGIYGGAIIVMLTDQPLDAPLDVTKIGKGGLKGLRVFDRTYVSAVDINMTDVLAGNYMLPNTYTLNGGTQNVHHSHVIRVPGAELPMRLRALNGWWDDSQLRRCLTDIKNAAASNAGIAALIQQANVDIINKKGLYNAIAAGDQDEQIASRYRKFNLMKSLYGLGLLDDNEEYSRNQISFGGLSDVMRAMMEWASGAVGIPITRLFGVQAKGLGNDTAGDQANYFNDIRSGQNGRYKRALRQLDEVLVRSALGHMPDDYAWHWLPLEQMNPNDVAQRQKTQAEKDEIRLNQGVPLSAVLRRLQSEGEYDISDEQIEQEERNEEAERQGEAAGRPAPEVEEEDET
ncbi:DUF1073 domain-containing protein [Zymobacter palmae]|uniref:Uncharacterized protein conserved in bacteria n=1 Tax=Zymobacter palmae TaxID=33074 RepID=A0A348HEC5_9GAMM|nr:DUF1073 domain-containing protein [Zymobacter palmae]BBG29977.1 uncharacterized protein conserved in bacteria [Zymobacter palmae]